MNRVAIIGFGASTYAAASLLACSRVSNEIIMVDQTAGITRGTKPDLTPILAERMMTLTACSSDYIPEIERREPSAGRGAHWQKHDRLPFYHGLKSRKRRR